MVFDQHYGQVAQLARRVRVLPIEMRILRALFLVPALLALLAGTALAKGQPPKPAGVDKGFGTKGVAKIATGGTNPQQRVRMALGANGRIYALQGNLLLAFQANGRPARAFGSNGRVRVTSTRGELHPTGIAVDSQGRIVVAGKIVTYPFTKDPVSPAGTPVIGELTLREAFVDRYLEDGSLDPTFGDAGEVDTTFGLPRPTGEPGKGVEFERPLVEATTLTVDPQDRPVVGGRYVDSSYNQYYGYGTEQTTSFVGRLTATGAPDTTYAGKGYTTGPNGAVEALAETPEGGVATLSWGHYPAHAEDEPTTFDALTEEGAQSPVLDPDRPLMDTNSLLAVDSKGRSLMFQFDSSNTEAPATLVRLLPSGALDTGFGFGGGIPLTGEEISPGAITVDAKNRTLVAVAGIQHPYGPRVIRYTAAGKRDKKFGHKGLLEGPIANDKRGGNETILVDGKGRIYTAGWVESKTLKTGHGIQITCFLPGK